MSLDGYLLPPTDVRYNYWPFCADTASQPFAGLPLCHFADHYLTAPSAPQFHPFSFFERCWTWGMLTSNVLALPPPNLSPDVGDYTGKFWSIICVAIAGFHTVA